MRYWLCIVLYNIVKYILDYFYIYLMDKFFLFIFNFYLLFDDMFEYVDIYVMFLNFLFFLVFLLFIYVFFFCLIINELSYVIVGLYIDRVDGYLLRGWFKVGFILRNIYKVLLYVLMIGYFFNKWVVKCIDIIVFIWLFFLGFVNFYYFLLCWYVCVG